MNVKLGDKLILKKNHPCGNNVFYVFRIGIDFKLRCEKCNCEIMITREKCMKMIKKIIVD